MFSIKFISNPSRNNTIFVRVVNDRKKAEFALGLKATREQLDSALSQNPAEEVLHLSKILKFYSTKIEEVRIKILEKGLFNESASVLAAYVKSALMPGAPIDNKGADKPGFATFYKKRMEANKNSGYKATIEYTYKKMQDFCADRAVYRGKPFDMLDFEDVNLKWLSDFDEWLVDQGSAKNSRNIHFKNIRTVFNRAIDEELTEKYPFRRFKIKPEATAKRAMTVESMRELFDYPVEEYQKFYLDMFKLIFMLIGINTADLYNLTGIVNGRIEYRRAKTHRLYSIKVEPEAMEIIERWRGEKNLLCIADRWKNHRDFNKNMNIALKKIGKHEKVPGRGGKYQITPAFPGISTYWARHSWATIARKLKISVDDIALALGHSTGHEVTRIYINEDREAIDAANRKVIDWVLYDRK